MAPLSKHIPWIRILAILAVFAILFAAVVAYRSASMPFPVPPEPRPFNSAVWKAKSSSDFHSDVRAAMLDDLLSRHDFTGWNRSKLESLLGPPDDLDLESWSDTPDKWDLGYRAGKDWIDYRVLVFDLDANGNVASYRVELY